MRVSFPAFRGPCMNRKLVVLSATKFHAGGFRRHVVPRVVVPPWRLAKAGAFFYSYLFSKKLSVGLQNRVLLDFYYVVLTHAWAFVGVWEPSTIDDSD